jgi:two-component system cell cycle sensor histidine kinase/response regulator CckA
VQADATMLEQVILNLAINARDAMPAGGRLAISTSAEQVGADHARQNPEAREGAFVALTVADTGSGIKSADLAHIFEPFFTTKAVGKGTGLGLATVYGIVKQHKGWLEIASQAGRGATFKVFLPAGAPAAEAPAAESPPATDPSRGHETILVVEDEELVRQLILSCLHRCGYRVLEAASGPEAVNLAARHAEEIDLLLTDMVMPGGMNGRELAEQLRSKNPTLKVIFSSGYSREMLDPGQKALASEFFLTKPYTPATLTRAVRECLDHRPPA